MSLLDILTEESVIVGLKGRDKTEIIEELVDALKPSEKVRTREKVLEAVLERERIMSTGIGGGIAIPHGKSEFVSELVGALGIKKEGVDFESLDGEPATIFFLLISPRDVSGPHVRALASISRLLKNGNCRKALVEAQSAKDVISIIAEQEKLEP